MSKFCGAFKISKHLHAFASRGINLVCSRFPGVKVPLPQVWHHWFVFCFVVCILFDQVCAFNVVSTYHATFHHRVCKIAQVARCKLVLECMTQFARRQDSETRHFQIPNVFRRCRKLGPSHFRCAQVITTEIDEGMDDNGIVLPGIGNFGEAWQRCSQMQPDAARCGDWHRPRIDILAHVVRRMSPVDFSLEICRFGRISYAALSSSLVLVGGYPLSSVHPFHPLPHFTCSSLPYFMPSLQDILVPVLSTICHRIV